MTPVRAFRSRVLPICTAMFALTAFVPAAAHAAAPSIRTVTVPKTATTPKVAVVIDAVDDKAVTRMRLATESGNFGAWQPFAASTDFTLTPGLGIRGVFVQVMDAGFDASNIVYVKTTRVAAPQDPARPVINGTDGIDFLDGCCDIDAKAGDDAVRWTVGNDFGGACFEAATGAPLPCVKPKVDCGAGEDFVWGYSYTGVGADTVNCEHLFMTKYPYAYPAVRALTKGTANADRINGTIEGDSIIAGDGNDQLFGNAAGTGEHDVDLLSGGAGNDTIDTGVGQKRFGHDLSSPTFVFAGAGDDVVIVRTQAKVECGAGYDIVYQAKSSKDSQVGPFQNTMNADCEEIIEMA